MLRPRWPPSDDRLMVTGRSVAVVGLGSMGSMALWQLAKRGIPTTGFEQFQFGHSNGAFSGETRMFRTAYSNGPHWVAVLREALAMWRTLETECGQALLDLNGFVSIGDPSGTRIASLIDCAVATGVDIEVLDDSAVRRRFPALGLEPGEVAVFDKVGGLIKPERAVLTALRRAKDLGAHLCPACPVTAIHPRKDGVIIETAAGTQEFGAAILTAGAWSSRFIPRGLVAPHRVGLHWHLARTPKLFGPRIFPPHIRYVQDRAICLFSSQDGSTVKTAVGGSLGELDHPSAARMAEAWEQGLLTDAISHHYPELWPDPVRSESYSDGFTPDGDGVIGPLPGTPQILVAAGFSAHGFKFAPVVGAALAELADTGKTVMPIHHLRLDRYNDVTGCERGQ